ncbi:MAG: AmmeMemoRadiSam system protein B, partial [Desulfobaccales bacterium]|nr:AmmeMemoRadiSam system protein B [Desulfobaccales bacterium]
KLDGAAMLAAAETDQSACSAGGAAAAVAAAKKSGATKARLIDYYTSYDIMPSDSFVGYAGIVLSG